MMSLTKPDVLDVSDAVLDGWATDPDGPVALHLKQTLLPVESLDDGSACIVYPPTYANIGYNVDTLSDGKNVALIDSVGSQANRMEPVFKSAADGQPSNPLADLVPQIEIVLSHGKKNDADSFSEKMSILDIAHRSADAVVRSSPTLVKDMDKAFRTLRQTGDCGHLCAVAPTSLVFGVWDSRESNEKRPRLVRSIIRAWDVDVLHAAAQYNSAWKSLDENQREQLDAEAKKLGKKLSEQGFQDAPAVFRKTSAMRDFLDGSPNPEKRVLGGVVVRDRIEREVTVNLVALRGLRGANPDETDLIRKYLLGLSLLAATANIDLFLREGCNLRYTGEDEWWEIPRRGAPSRTDMAESKDMLNRYARAAHKDFSRAFKDRIPDQLEHKFDLGEAKKLLIKTTADEDGD